MWLDLNIMTYVLERGCEQVSHVVIPLMDKSAFHTQHCMINIESLAARTCRWKVFRCPAVPKAERRIPFCSGRSFLTLVAMLLTNSRHTSSVPAHLTSVVLGSYSHEAAVGRCYSALPWC